MMAQSPNIEILLSTLQTSLDKARRVSNEHEIEKTWISELSKEGHHYIPKKYAQYELFSIPCDKDNQPKFNEGIKVDSNNYKEHPSLHADINLTKTIIEFKRFYAQVDADPCIYLDKSIESSKFNKWPSDNNEWSAEALFVENENKYFTFFKEGQIWHDISRLLSFSQSGNQLFLAGVFNHEIYENKKPVYEIKERLSDKDYIVGKLTSIISYFQLSKCYGTYYMPSRNNILKLEFEGSFDFTINKDMVVIGKNKSGYLVEIKKTNA